MLSTDTFKYSDLYSYYRLALCAPQPWSRRTLYIVLEKRALLRSLGRICRNTVTSTTLTGSTTYSIIILFGISRN